MPKLHATQNSLPAKSRQALIAPLNQLLAEALTTYTHAKQAHWNVRGPQFIALHELFDNVSKVLLTVVDDLAERAMQLGGEAHGDVHAAAKATSLKPYPALSSLKAEGHIKAVAHALSVLSEATREGIETAENVDDAVTADMLTSMTGELEKYLWFVESHLA